MKKTYSYFYLMPGLLIFLAFFFAPSVGSFYYSFGRWNGVNFAGFCGFDNYISIFSDHSLNHCFQNTLVFAVATLVLKVVLGLLLALLANMRLRTREFFKSVVFFPVILSSVAAGLTFSAIMHPEIGLLNVFLRRIGLGALASGWLVDSRLIMFSLATIEVWKWVGLNMVLFLAALQGIPGELYESASIDGAGTWKKFTSITLPMLIPILNTNIILSVIGGLTAFDTIYATTGGGPGTMSEVINTFVLRSFSQGRYGESTAANVILFLAVGIIAVGLQKFLARFEGEV